MNVRISLGALALLAGCAGAPADRHDAIGDPVPVTVSADALHLDDLDGHPVDVAARLAEGRAVALVFWQSWCENCLDEAPALAAAARAHGDHLDFVGVVPGPDEAVDEAAVRARIAEFDLPYPSVRDRELTLTRAFEVTGTPTIVVLEGSPPEVVWRGHRPPASWDRFGSR